MGVDDETEDEVEEPVNNISDSEVITDDISHIYALEGRQRPDPIELVGAIGTRAVRILVDTGSSHDFLHPRVAEQLALPLTAIKPFRVYVGNGASLACTHASMKTKLIIQNNVFPIDLHILPVHGPEIILGRTWLKMLHRVTSDYDDGTIEFMRDGKLVCLTLSPSIPKSASVRIFAGLLSLQGDSDLFEVVRIDGKDGAETTSGEQAFPAHLPPPLLEAL